MIKVGTVFQVKKEGGHTTPPELIGLILRVVKPFGGRWTDWWWCAPIENPNMIREICEDEMAFLSSVNYGVEDD